ncbi:DUF805 domain-containing protein [Pukyongiella litopenaei]|uniref:DUF805 domain-containing protein n=1 Tax=Pukyongiella litopenaei TaxID=2605946 RepID=A0A2S0MNH3_9RHOB|nr:DUF805 domain-containing protein [Pukyongiella litopenaei]AVO37424.1 DUF805 domain-containing protein [Pukyongiella litopenaei]
MGFQTAIRTCLGKYLTFSGRASRPEYWWFFLFVLLSNVVAGLVDMAMFGQAGVTEADGSASVTAYARQPVQGLVGLALFLPHLAAAFRRMHDTGRSGWYALLPTLLGLGALVVLVFGIGAASHFHGGTMDRLLTGATLLILLPTLLVLLISPLLVLWWLTRPSQPGANQYGPNPREVTQ